MLPNPASQMPIQSWKSYFEEPVSIAGLVTFRILFGLTMVFSTLRFMALGWIENQYTQPIVHFSYYGFDWVKPLQVEGMYLVFGLMALASLLIILGAYYRLASSVFFILFTYVELLDKTYYLNHYYFVSLVSFMLVWVPAHRAYSWDVWRQPKLQLSHIPRWMLGVFRLQLAIVYIYAGMAKISYDWLVLALPLKIWLPAKANLPWIGFIFRYKMTSYLFSWGGMLYDLFIPFLLLYRPTRVWAYLAVIGFHTMTGLLFQIGVFPLVMIMLSLVFFPTKLHQQVLDYVGKGLRAEPSTPRPRRSFSNRMLPGFFLVFIFIQLLFPWRYVLYPGNFFWTEEAYRFSWRVMLMEKAGTATFYVKDTCTGREGVVVNSEFLNAHQEKQMAMQPDMILQFAHFLGEHYAQQGLCAPEVRAEVYVTLNGRPSELLIDPRVNLTQKSHGWAHKDWILPHSQLPSFF